ncbi:hypothetical protein BB561_006124 [Smittium simulii]|uniref:Uncharacterized protein n=1 Tax=Smittium simulii TaxID=133385 RepID=A0A2T9Y6G4_9FUNG|nr:hypothetical protein BB561_006124 [Smittium simulii]
MDNCSKDIDTIKAAIELLQKEAEYNNQPLIAIKCQNLISFLNKKVSNFASNDKSAHRSQDISPQTTQTTSEYNITDTISDKITTTQKTSTVEAEKHIVQHLENDLTEKQTVQKTKPAEAQKQTAQHLENNLDGSCSSTPQQDFDNDSIDPCCYYSELSSLFLYCLLPTHSSVISAAALIIFAQLLDYPSIAAAFKMVPKKDTSDELSTKDNIMSMQNSDLIYNSTDSILGSIPDNVDTNFILNKPLLNCALNQENNLKDISNVIVTIKALSSLHNLNYSNYSSTWLDLIIEATCSLFSGSKTDDRLQNQITNTMSAILSKVQHKNSTQTSKIDSFLLINNTTLLIIMQTLGNMYLFSKNLKVKNKSKYMIILLVKIYSKYLVSKTKDNNLYANQTQDASTMLILLVCWNYTPLSELKIEYVNETLKSINSDLTLINSFIIAKNTFKICTEFYIPKHAKLESFTFPMQLLDIFLKEYYANFLESTNKQSVPLLNSKNSSIIPSPEINSSSDINSKASITSYNNEENHNKISNKSPRVNLFENILKFVPSIIIAYGATSYTEIFTSALELLETCCKFNNISRVALYNIIEQSYISKITAKISPLYSDNSSSFKNSQTPNNIKPKYTFSPRSNVLSLISSYSTKSDNSSLKPSPEGISDYDLKLKQCQTFAIEHIKQLLSAPNVLENMITPLEDPPKILLVNIIEALCLQIKNGVGFFAKSELKNQTNFENASKNLPIVENDNFSKNTSLPYEMNQSYQMHKNEHSISSEYSDYQRSITLMALETINSIADTLSNNRKSYNSEYFKLYSKNQHNVCFDNVSSIYLSPPNDYNTNEFTNSSIRDQNNTTLDTLSIKASTNNLICNDVGKNCITNTCVKTGLDDPDKALSKIDTKLPFIDSLVCFFSFIDCQTSTDKFEKHLCLISKLYSAKTLESFYFYYNYGYNFFKLSSFLQCIKHDDFNSAQSILERYFVSQSEFLTIFNNKDALNLIKQTKLHFYCLIDTSTLQKITLKCYKVCELNRNCFKSIWIPILASISQLFESLQNLYNEEIYPSFSAKNTYQIIISKLKELNHENQADKMNKNENFLYFNEVDSFNNKAKYTENPEHCISKTATNLSLKVLCTCINISIKQNVQIGVEALLTALVSLIGLAKSTKDESWKNRRAAVELLQIYTEFYNILGTAECIVVLKGLSSFYFKHYNAISDELANNKNLQIELLHKKLATNTYSKNRASETDSMMQPSSFSSSSFSIKSLSQFNESPNSSNRLNYTNNSTLNGDANNQSAFNTGLYNQNNSEFIKKQCNDQNNNSAIQQQLQPQLKTHSINQLNNFLCSIENKIFEFSQNNYPFNLDILYGLCNVSIAETKKYLSQNINYTQDCFPILKFYSQNFFSDYAHVENVFYSLFNNHSETCSLEYSNINNSNIDFNPQNYSQKSHISAQTDSDAAFDSDSIICLLSEDQYQTANTIIPGSSVFEVVSETLVQLITQASNIMERSNPLVKKIHEFGQDISNDSIIKTLLNPLLRASIYCVNLHVQYIILYLVKKITDILYRTIDFSNNIILEIISTILKECIKIGISQADQLYSHNDTVSFYISDYNTNNVNSKNNSFLAADKNFENQFNTRINNSSKIRNLAYCSSSIAKLLTRNIFLCLKILENIKNYECITENTIKNYIECVGLATSAIVYTQPIPNISKLFCDSNTKQNNFSGLQNYQIAKSKNVLNHKGCTVSENNSWSINNELIICGDSKLFNNNFIFSLVKTIISLWEYSANHLIENEKNICTKVDSASSSFVALPLEPLLLEIFKVTSFAIEPLFFDGKLSSYLFGRQSAPSDSNKTFITGCWNYCYNPSTIESAMHLNIWPIYNILKQMVFDVWYTNIQKIKPENKYQWIINCNNEFFEIIQKLVLLPDTLENIECLILPWVDILFYWSDYIEINLGDILEQDNDTIINVFKSFINLILAYMHSLNKKMYTTGIEIFSKLFRDLVEYSDMENSSSNIPCELWAHLTGAFESVIYSKCLWGLKSMDSVNLSLEIMQLKMIELSYENEKYQKSSIINHKSIFIDSLKNLKPLLKRQQFLIDMQSRSNYLIDMIKFVREIAEQGYITRLYKLNSSGVYLALKWHKIIIVTQGFARAISTLVASKSIVLEKSFLVENISKAIHSPLAYSRYANVEFSVLLENICTFSFIESLFALHNDIFIGSNVDQSAQARLNNVAIKTESYSNWVQETLIKYILLIFSSYINAINVNKNRECNIIEVTNNINNKNSLPTDINLYSEDTVSYNTDLDSNSNNTNYSKIISTSEQITLINAENFKNFIETFEKSKDYLMLPVSSLSRLVIKALTNLIELLDGLEQNNEKNTANSDSNSFEHTNNENINFSKPLSKKKSKKRSQKLVEKQKNKGNSFILSNHTNLLLIITDIISITEFQTIKALGAEFIKKSAKAQ